PQADEGARATAPTRLDHFPAPSFPTTDRWCYKHRSVPAFVRLLTARVRHAESRHSSYSNLSCISVAWGDLLSPQRRVSIDVNPIGSSRRHMTGLTIRLVISRRCL